MSKQKAQPAIAGYSRSIAGYTVTAVTLRPISRKALRSLNHACEYLAIILRLDCPATTLVVLTRDLAGPTPSGSLSSKRISTKHSGGK